MNKTNIIIAIGLSLALSGCITDYKLYRTTHISSFGNHNFASYNQNNDLLTIIHGNPTNASQDELNAAVTGAMQGRNAYGKTNFTTNPDDSNNPRTKFVIQFNPSTSKSARDLCAKPTPMATTPAKDGKLVMMMAYCFRNNFIAYTLAETSTPETPNDPAFLSMIGGSVQKLIPPYDPNNKGRCRNVPICD